MKNRTMWILPFLAIMSVGCLAEPVELEESSAVAQDAITGPHFLLEVSGITPDQKTIVGGFRFMTHTPPTASSPGTLVFEQGRALDAGLFTWADGGKLARRDCSVILAGDDGSEIMRYNAFVRELDGPVGGGPVVDKLVLEIVASD